MDDLTAIAQARATMMLRGYAPLRLDMGAAAYSALVDRYAPGGFEDDPDAPQASVFGMPLTVRCDMEGWAVVPG